MSLIIGVDLLTGSYDAADADDRSRCEWPPHPARLFCALVAAARTEAERDALRWLEAQQPPLVAADLRHGESSAVSYVVTNKTEQQPKSQSRLGRSNQLRRRTRAFPAAPTVRFMWPSVEADEELRGRLDGVCRRVPYLGRATGLATLTATVSSPDFASDMAEDPPLSVLEPCDQVDGELLLRAPYAGYLAELEELHAADQPAWQASRYLYYRTRRPDNTTESAPALEPSVYRDVVVLRFRGLRPDGRLVARFTAQLRRRVLRAAGPGAPAALHGHGADGRPHVAFLALPNAATSFAGETAGRPDGHLLGLAVAIPDLPADQRRAVLSAVLGLRRRGEAGAANPSDLVVLDVPGIGGVELQYAPGLVRPWGATPERWRRGSTVWATATPILLDRFPKRGTTVEDIVLGSVRQVGLPEPVDIQVSVAAILPGAVQLQPVDLPDKFGGRLFRHAVLTFDRPVAGPVLLGAGRYLGVGLLAPVSTTTSDAASSARHLADEEPLASHAPGESA